MADYKALYRKWRPVDFDDVCGQKSITDILKYEVDTNKISHAYLFCGSRGTGKTSCAKILAKAVNCLNPRGGNPCNACPACLSIDAGTSTDVLEMDAASNNGVDDVRILKDEISFTPAELKYRVYIIDEVHMMSTQAFNALLKTLEEPPSYVVFILATTEYNKLPTTIVSRCQRFDFRRMTSEVICQRLGKISESEGINLTDDGARLIARAARGGMRDAVSLLELCAGAREKIDAELVSATLGIGDRGLVYKLVEAVGNADYPTVYSVVEQVVSGSADISVFWQEIIDTYRDVMVVKKLNTAKSYLDLTEGEYRSLLSIAEGFSMSALAYHTDILTAALVDMQRSTNSKRSIAEIALTRMCDAKLVSTPEALTLRIEELEKQIALMKMGVVSPKNPPAPQADEPQTAQPEPKSETREKEVVPQEPAEQRYTPWEQLIDRVAELKPSLASGIKKSQVFRISTNKFVIKLGKFFASLLMKNENNLAIIRGVIAEKEGMASSEISILVEAVAEAQQGTFTDEIENALKF